MARWSIEGTVATTYTGTSIELAKPDTAAADSALLVSIPSVSTMMALCVPARAASRRAVAAVASYSEVRAKWLKIGQGTARRGQIVREILPFVERLIEREHRHLVFARTQLRQDGIEGLARHGDLRADPHAAAHVHQDGEADRRPEVGAQ